MSKSTHVEEDDVAVGVSVVAVDAVEALRELDVAELLAELRVHEEAHGLAHGLAVVDVVVAVEVEDEGRVGEHGGHAHQRVHGAGLLVVVVPGALLAGHVHQPGELPALHVQRALAAQVHLDHPRVVPRVVPRPRRAVLHRPPFLGLLLRLGHQRVDAHLELLVLPLPFFFICVSAERTTTIHILVCQDQNHRPTFMARRSLTKVGCTLSLR
jgi:hypothetical protein